MPPWSPPAEARPAQAQGWTPPPDAKPWAPPGEAQPVTERPDFTDRYNTKLTDAEEPAYQDWRAKLPKRLQYEGDYDLRGAYKAGAQEAANGHLTDQFKKPNHETFSNESQYAVGEDAAKAGHWEGEGQAAKFVPPTAVAKSPAAILPPPDTAAPTETDADRMARWRESDSLGIPVPAVEQHLAKSFANTVKGWGRGVMRGGVSVHDLLATMGGLVTAGGIDDKTRQAADELQNQLRKNSNEYWTTPEGERTTAGEIGGSLAEMAIPLAASGGNPAVLVATTTLSVGKDLVDQGVDAKTAGEVAAVAGASVYAGTHLPFIGSNLTQRVASGTIGNVAFGAAEKEKIRGILDSAGYHKIADSYASTTESLIVDALSGAAFGGVAHLHARAAEADETVRRVNEALRTGTGPGGEGTPEKPWPYPQLPKSGDQAAPPADNSVPPTRPPGAPEAPAWKPPPEAQAAPAAEQEPVERYQFMKNSDGRAIQAEIRPLDQARFVQYVRPVLHDGYAMTLEEYQKKHPDATHIMLTRGSPEEPWKLGPVSSAEGMVDRLRTHEKTLRQVPDFDSPQAKEWAAIDRSKVPERDTNAVDAKNDTLLTAIAKMGGLSRDEAEKAGVDPAEFGRRAAGIKLVFAEKGLKAEDLAERLAQRGYPVSQDGTFSGQALMDRVHDELAGRETRSVRGQEGALEQQEREARSADERAFREKAAGVERAYGDDYDGEKPVAHTLGEPADYPADFDQQAKNLADLAVMAREVASEEDVHDALMAGSDAQAARELWGIIKGGEIKPAAQPAPAGGEVSAAAPEGERAAAQTQETDVTGSQADEQGQQAKQTKGRGATRGGKEGAKGTKGAADAGKAAREPTAPAAADTQRESEPKPAAAAAAATESPVPAERKPGGVRERESATPPAEPDTGAAVREVKPFKLKTKPAEPTSGVNEFKGKVFPGFENAADPERGDTELLEHMNIDARYLYEFDGKPVVVDVTEEGVGSGPHIEMHGRLASRTGYRSIFPHFGKDDTWDPAQARERAESIAMAHYETEKGGAYGIFHFSTTKGVSSSIGLPYWANKDIVAALETIGFKRKERQHDSYAIDIAKADAARLKQALAPLTAKGTIFEEDDALLRKLKASLEKGGFGGAFAPAAQPAPKVESPTQVTLGDMKKVLGELQEQKKGRVSDARLDERISNIEKMVAAIEPPLTPQQRATREAIGFASEKIDIGDEVAPPPRDEDVAAIEERLSQVRERASNIVAKDALEKARTAEYGSPAQGGFLKIAAEALYRQQPDLSGVVEEIRDQLGFGDHIDSPALLTQKDIDVAAHEAAASPKNALPQPTQAQKEANGEGNYKLGEPVKLYGVTWRVENPKGSYRTNLPSNEVEKLVSEYKRGRKLMADYKRGLIPQVFETLGRLTDDIKGAKDRVARLREILKDSWYAKLAAHYGRAVGVRGADGDALDAFLGPRSADQTLPVYVIDTNRLDGKGFDESKVMIGFDSAAAAHETFNASYNEGIADKIFGAITEMAPEDFRRWAQSDGVTRPASSKVAAAPAKEVPNEPEQPVTPETRKPAGAQPEPVSRPDQPRPAREVRPNDRGAGAARPEEPGTLGLFDGRGVGEREVGLSETLGPAAVDFARDHRPGRDLEGGRVDGRSVESRRARSSGSAAASTNYVITADDAIGKGGVKTKAQQNLDAIRIVKALVSERRPATSEEQAALVKYVGWGGMPQIFDATKKDWAKEHEALKALLTDDEYAAARRSTQDAHYTSETVVRGMYAALDRLGLKGGKVLEPAAGIGHFFGMMPEALRAGSQLTGVELDPMTAAIATALYPTIKVHNVGYQDFAVPDGFYDAVIGNPPFGDQKLFDPNRKALNDFSIHNYFIAKAVDTTRPGGIVAVVVSRYFMDSVHSKAREYIAGKAKLLGAIRLPNTAFADNANTEVVTDIVFLQRLPEGSSEHRANWWRDPVEVEGGRINGYFAANPRMVLGKHAATGSMYRGNDYTVEPTGKLDEQLAAAIQLLPENVVTVRAAEHVAEVQAEVIKDVDPTLVQNVQTYGYFERDGKMLQRMPDEAGEPRAEAVEIEGASKERMRALIKLRDAVKNQLRLELADDAGMSANRAALNKAYDAVVRNYGYVHAQGNKNVFSGDPSYPLLAALETDYDRGISSTTAKAQGVQSRKPSAGKAAIFRRRVLVPFHAASKVTSAKDALMASLAQRGRIDPEYIASVYEKPFAEVMQELGDRVFELHDGSGWTTSDAYLSGNVKAKLKEASAAAKRDGRFERNAQALARVIPADLEPVDISVGINSPWVASKDIEAFARHLFGDNTSASITYVPALGKFSARIRAGDQILNQSKWGTSRMFGDEILGSFLRGTPIKIYDKGPDDSAVLNKDATLAATEKLNEIRNEHKDWIWKDEERRTRLARVYNDTFNTNVERKFDGSHLGRTPEGAPQPFPGATPLIELRPHQKDFVWRFIQEGTVLADHVVGAGKTFAFITGVMERKRLGLIHKPILTVPNHLVDQWAADFNKLYPGAKVLAATKKDFERGNRRRFMGKIATGDWDAVIIAHSSFGFIGMPLTALRRFIDDQVADIKSSEEALRANGSSDKRSIKQMEKAKERLEAKYEAQVEASKKDDVVALDEMGVDALIVDEAHEFKNLMYATSLGRNIAGLGNTEGSIKAMDMFVKSQFILERNGGQNLGFATGTPISNTLAEMYTMQRYMAFKELRSRGLAHFDAWASTFADAIADWEIKASGQGLELKTRFRAFTNFPELMRMYRSFADVVTQQDLKKMREAEGKPSLTPPIATGGPQNIVVERSLWQAMKMDEIVKRSENLPTDPSIDNMLKVTNDARKMALDPRLVDPEVGDHDGSKVNDAARRIKGFYDQWHAKKGTQLVFIDLSTPKGNQTQEQRRIADIVQRAEEGDEAAQEEMAKLSPDDIMAAGSLFDVYNDLKGKLVDAGVPEAEVEFIHSANTELQKEALFERMRQGASRILIGSTKKMGAGMNVQRRLVALHHLDAPWRPSDLEQREGRIVRQGNLFYEGDPERGIEPVKDFAVSLFRYATKQTYDARMWQTIENKARFIEQARHANMTDRIVEDIGGEAANAAAMKAAASGNPLIEEEIKIRSDIKKLENLQREHARGQHSLAAFIKNNADVTTKLEADLKLIDADIAAVKPVDKGQFAGITVRDKPISDKKKAGMAVAIELAQFIKSGKDSTSTVGTYRGLPFFFTAENAKQFGLSLEGKARNYTTMFSPDQEIDPLGVITRLDNLLADIPELRAWRESVAAKTLKEVESAKAEIDKPFKQAEELQQKRARHQEVVKELSAKKEDEKGASEGLEPRYGDFKLGQGIGVRVAEPFIRDIVSRWKGMPAQVIVTTRKGLSGVPENIKQGIEYLDPTHHMMGVTHKASGSIYMFADNLPSLQEAERILIHEVKGHAGIQAYLGDEWPRFRELALRVFKKDAAAQAALIHARLNTTAGRDRVGSEVVAVITERIEAGTATATMQKFWDRLVAAVMRFLRRLGFKDYTPTEVELRNVIRDAARAVEHGPITKEARVSSLEDGDLLAAMSDPDNEEDMVTRRSEASDRNGKSFLRRVLDHGQPIDEAFSLLLRPFGSIDEKRVFHLDPRAKVYAKLGMETAQKIIKSDKFRWLRDPIQRGHNALNEKYNVDEVARAAIETAKRGLLDRYGQSEEFKTRSMGVEADRRSILLQGEDLLKKLLEAGVESKEAEVMYRMMTADGASEEEKAALGADIAKLAPEIREVIDHMGREYVELGLLDAATFEYWRSSYLPRSYMKHEAEKSSLLRMASGVLDARRKRIIGRQFRRRGLEIVKTQARILRDVPEDWWGRRQEAGKADTSLVGHKFVVLERVKQYGEGTLNLDVPGMAAKKVDEQVTARIFWPADVAIPEKWRGFENRGVFEVTGTKGGDVTLWRDYTREERTRMTEIVDVRYAVAKAFMQASNDISNGRFFRDIAQNHDWASTTDPVGNSPNASERVWSTSAGADWVRVPETTAPGTKTPKYGALAGMYVRQEVWNDINQTVQMQKAGFWKSLLTVWKLNKTARNPVVHFNNIMSNVMLADMIDVRARDLVRGIRSYSQEDSYYRSALEHGAFGADIVTQELKQTILGPVLKDLERESVDKTHGVWGVVGRLYSGIRAFDQKMIQAYRLEDEVFRMAAYLRELEHGATPAEAARHAREQFLDYDIRAPWINALRQSFLPFLAYTYRALPVVANSIASRPWKLAKYFGVAYLFNMLAYMLMDDDDEDQERATLRQEEQGLTWLGMERMLRAPFNDRFGNPVFWDVRRMVPAGDVFDMNQGSSAAPFPAPLQFGGPLMMAAEFFLNKTGFTGDAITNELTDSPGEKTTKVADWLWKSVAPTAPWIPGSWYWSKIEAAATGELDPRMREYSIPLAVSSSLGLKLKPHDVNLQRRYQMMDVDRVERALMEQMRSLSTDLARQRISRPFYDSEVKNIQGKMVKLNERRRELSPR